MSPQTAHALKCVPSSSEDLFQREVFAGLRARPRSLSPHWFYDSRGSELFEAITVLPEYYVTRALIVIDEERRLVRCDHFAPLRIGRELTPSGSFKNRL
jgi:uncharacterized SAM-dependent methyltransferase